MKTVVGQLVLVIILVIAGAVLWTVGSAEQRLAAAEKTLVTLRYDQAAEEFQSAAATNAAERIIADATGMANTATESRRKALYWMGDYQEFLESSDADLKMLAADASYRAMRTDGGTWQSVTTKLDAIAKRYADVLREHPENEDAAYNYEFVVRLRTAVAAAKQPIPALDLDNAGLTVHGHRGGPPEGSDTKKFKMIVPMRPDERMEAEQAGRGAQKIRKG
jgi:hypothetical protein